MKTVMLQILLFLLPLLCCLQTRADIVEDFSQTRGVNAGSSSMLVIDLSTGETVLEMNADIPLIPASIMKCVTTATLLSRLDEDARFHTEVYAAGTVRDGILDGNLIIVGSGDPSLNSRHVEGNKDICSQIAAALTERGVRSIAGRIVVDEDVWSGPAVPPSWMSEISRMHTAPVLMDSTLRITLQAAVRFQIRLLFLTRVCKRLLSVTEL